ncbi:hypothetical protein DPM19_03070 [Actinomadura craniellae]|uniref:Uncharacterized protein n=1 Tax=Actinomadura craniellae TaxID=2231787 RepID=A0A365HDP4_9ACTN|nr:hypothetical protein [Actinomadura craniellae]RAY17152.1 hypothetical protein DPM19_03070 [Actinomadura craniellae]
MTAHSGEPADERARELVRDYLDGLVEDVELPDDMALRVIMGSAPPRRARRAAQLSLVCAAVATVAVTTVLGAGIVRDPGPSPAASPVATAAGRPAAYDPTAMIKFGYVPAGLREENTPLLPGPGLMETRPVPEGTRRWLMVYRGSAPPGQRRKVPLIIVTVTTGKVDPSATRDTLHTLDQARPFGPVWVPRGTATGSTSRGHHHQSIVLWRPRPDLVILVQGVNVATEETYRFLRGIALSD